MSKIQEEGEATFKTSQARNTDLKLEAVVIPVSDVDRAKSFYSKLGWRLDADFVAGESFRVVQFTPPGSPASVHFGKGLTSATPGAAQNIYLIVSDIKPMPGAVATQFGRLARFAGNLPPPSRPCLKSAPGTDLVESPNLKISDSWEWSPKTDTVLPVFGL